MKDTLWAFSPTMSNRAAHTDTQQQVAAARRMPRAGGLRRYASAMIHRALIISLPFAILSGASFASESNLAVGFLDRNQCAQTAYDQRYWQQVAPQAATNEKFCVLGFPGEPGVAQIKIDSRIIKVRLTLAPSNREVFESEDRKTKIVLRYLKVDDNCNTGEDKCCGISSTAMLTAYHHGRSKSLRVSNYQGG
jgi:hypothetical protein